MSYNAEEFEKKFYRAFDAGKIREFLSRELKQKSAKIGEGKSFEFFALHDATFSLAVGVEKKNRMASGSKEAWKKRCLTVAEKRFSWLAPFKIFEMEVDGDVRSIVVMPLFKKFHIEKNSSEFSQQVQKDLATLGLHYADYFQVGTSQNQKFVIDLASLDVKAPR